MPVPSPGRFVSAQVLSQGNVGGQLYLSHRAHAPLAGSRRWGDWR